MRATILAGVILTLSIPSGCGKKDNGRKHNEEPNQTNRALAATRTTPTKAMRLSAEDLHRRYLRAPKPELLFANERVAVTGAVLRALPRRVYQIILKAGPARQQISLVFRDDGHAARSQNPAKGDSLSADCMVSGRLAMRVELADCVLLK